MPAMLYPAIDIAGASTDVSGTSIDQQGSSDARGV
jgi:hypothetical protein